MPVPLSCMRPYTASMCMARAAVQRSHSMLLSLRAYAGLMHKNACAAFAWLQPAESEMITILHFNLINPIMLGNKKTKDVQFYAEVMDVVQVCACVY